MPEYVSENPVKGVRWYIRQVGVFWYCLTQGTTETEFHCHNGPFREKEEARRECLDHCPAWLLLKSTGKH